ncbi:MAG: 4-hydroxy-tetrahydrodipicolinate synthase [Rhodospirillaceae bacterium]|jgi:4-hydroxy-tetrahydrodipicolinate synthase|nr:4-hydroxy-tetrahydrodipicolinate synthase [Rhodospirillaceae bacterium]
MIKGSITALITPFLNGRLDEIGFQSFVEWQISEGANGFVPCGTTGEAPTLSHEEHHLVVRLCVEAVNGKVPVIAGAGSNSTAEAIDLVRSAKIVGADAVLVTTPYYNKPTQEGLYQHFKAINDAVEIPIFIYNIPGRSVVDININTMVRLAKLVNIVGIKDATNDIVRPIRTRIALGEKFCQLSGEDANFVAFLAHGGSGCISVTANIAPKLCACLYDAWESGNMTMVYELRDKLSILHDSMFCETNPAPVKYATSLLNKCDGSLRLPLVEIGKTNKQKVKNAMQSIGLI